MTIVYGISNCDTVKKARAWLVDNGVDFTFVDFKKTPPTQAQLTLWLAQVPLDTLLNKRGTTWRKLSDEQKASAENMAEAIQLMMMQPSVIKRPVLEHAGNIYVGFQTASYESIFEK